MLTVSGKTITTIVAPATLIGESGITVIRISGPHSFKIADKLFSAERKKYKSKSLSEQQGYTIHHGYIFKRGKVLDEVLVLLFRAPNSYTGEDVVEISLHGGKAMFRNIIELLLNNGCIYAAPGEFTKRAFLNGKMDLVQAEAVADLIRSKTEQSALSAAMQLSGRLTNKINELRERLINVCSLLELELDFLEEGLEVISKEKVSKGIEEVIKTIHNIVNTYQGGRVLREGINLIITGEPNVGKSSIFNYMLNDSRAIVTDIPGTTRDYLEESLILGGIKFNLVDTAGIREARDEIEKIGVERSFQKIEEADIVINIYDARKMRTKDSISKSVIKTKNQIEIYNKSDLLKKKVRLNKKALQVSAKTGKNINLIESKIVEIANNITNKATHSEIYITNSRHKDLLTKALERLKAAQQTVKERRGNEIISFEIREAIAGLDEIIGKTTNTEILNNIFQNFA